MFDHENQLKVSDYMKITSYLLPENHAACLV
jgi:hypothetical protein